MNRLGHWLDHRTGVRQLSALMLFEHIPGGSRWRYVWGSTLVFAFVTQLITGVFLWMAYSPSSQTAWESVHYIQNDMQGGWLLRGIHHFMAQAMIVLLGLHLLQVVIDKAYRAPREINFWIGLVLMLLVLALALTGYLLPWDQKGYWATKVATNLMALTPFVGENLQRLVVGGSDYGHHTLTRFFAMHAGVLPGLVILFIIAHVALFRRHGLTVRQPLRRPDQFFWPHQILKDAIASLVVLGVVLLFTIHFDVVGAVTGNLPLEHRGAELTAPADPADDYGAARPEWYFLFLFQMLKYFEADWEVVGAIVVPTVLMGILLLMPIVGRWKVGHVFNCTFLVLLLAGAGILTGLALHQDYFVYSGEWLRYDDEEYESQLARSESFLSAKEQAEEDYKRIQHLIAMYGVPRAGAITLLRNDPVTQGPRLFQRHCASCHSYLNPEGNGIAGPEPSEHGSPNGAPNLYGFATIDWFRKLLDPDVIASDEIFGRTAHAEGEMVAFVHEELNADVLADEQREALEALIVALAAEADLPAREEADAEAEASGVIEQGREVFVNPFQGYSCVDCHKLDDMGDLGTAPDLTGYGSHQWLWEFIANPAGDRFYGENNDRMMAFYAHPGTPGINLLTSREMELIVRWLRGDNRVLLPTGEIAPPSFVAQE